MSRRLITVLVWSLHRFFGYWDDRSNVGGTLHNLVIYYFLSDDTMQISEDLPENSGQELGSTLLRRTPVPKVQIQNFIILVKVEILTKL